MKCYSCNGDMFIINTKNMEEYGFVNVYKCEECGKIIYSNAKIVQKEKTVEKCDINNGTSFTSLLALLFIGLKLTGYISWSWIWVLSPFWIVVLLIFAIYLFC